MSASFRSSEMRLHWIRRVVFRPLVIVVSKSTPGEGLIWWPYRQRTKRLTTTPTPFSSQLFSKSSENNACRAQSTMQPTVTPSKPDIAGSRLPHVFGCGIDIRLRKRVRDLLQHVVPWRRLLPPTPLIFVPCWDDGAFTRGSTMVRPSSIALRTFINASSHRVARSCGRDGQPSRIGTPEVLKCAEVRLKRQQPRGWKNLSFCEAAANGRHFNSSDR